MVSFPPASTLNDLKFSLLSFIKVISTPVLQEVIVKKDINKNIKMFFIFSFQILLLTFRSLAMWRIKEA
jgi:hypothetical protein